MRSMVAQSLVWGACLVASLTTHSSRSNAANCALYVRAETGVALFGSAGGWWDEADGRYERGHVPAVGAILIFKRTQQIPSGHVAVVARIISGHEILVDHANWYHGTVTRGMSVIDTSPDQTWTSVAVMNPPSGTHGRDYPTYGFVYPRSGPRDINEIRDGGGADPFGADESPRSTLAHFAISTDNRHRETAVRGNHHPKKVAYHPARTVSSAHERNHQLARAKDASRAGAARPPTRPVRTTEAKQHQV